MSDDPEGGDWLREDGPQPHSKLEKQTQKNMLEIKKITLKTQVLSPQYLMSHILNYVN